MGSTERDAVTGRETTGHEWDGIKELNTPLPKWWVYVFIATIVWSFGYWVVYPAWPGISGYTKGLIGYNTRASLDETMQAASEARRQWTDRIAASSVEEIAADPDLLAYSVAGGRTLFAENCAPCHGAGGEGAPGYPNLADDSWMWGGELATIEQTIRYGVRSGHESARVSEMPRFGLDGLLERGQISDAAEHVLSLSGASTDAAAAARGATVYAENCASCHGETGAGNRELGAPALNDAIWLYAGDKAGIEQQVTKPRHGVMPTWSGRLDEVSIKLLSVYVHSLGGGE
ncbi:MAG: cytochrome c oxidase, cbb3-type subunit [Rhodospirillales bacterium]|jgi:cytochrome c oxidase cbb3-type subunit 3|nr:cytochrome c oxidase, cbb3-type subunit [Rhodospirillales bacterium]